MKRIVRFGWFLVAVALLLMGAQAPEESWTWLQFLLWMSTPGGISVVVGILLSVLIEYVPVFGALLPKWKRVVFFGLCLVIPVLAALLGIWTLEWAPTWQATFWPALLAGILTFASGTMTHLPKLPDMPKLPSNV